MCVPLLHSLCDVIWRLFRPLVIGCDKPRLPDHNPEKSGGNPLDYFPHFSLKEGDKELVTIYKLAPFLDAVEKWRRAGDDDDNTFPNLKNYIDES